MIEIMSFYQSRQCIVENMSFVILCVKWTVHQSLKERRKENEIQILTNRCVVEYSGRNIIQGDLLASIWAFQNKDAVAR